MPSANDFRGVAIPLPLQHSQIPIAKSSRPTVQLGAEMPICHCYYQHKPSPAWKQYQYAQYIRKSILLRSRSYLRQLVCKVLSHSDKHTRRSFELCSVCRSCTVRYMLMHALINVFITYKHLHNK